ncbi:serine/threonine kinase receptor associated protein [Atractiella rhizophila]|nr:serine/threonine kinase receptor associated protein [Atractiella rhizophila]KAH8930047.1 serine/threonine kinase receptor associated protein [Atractiella rhizophila]
MSKIVSPSPVQAKQSTPLVCSGHTRPVIQLEFSSILPPDLGGNYLLISSCKDGKPMLRDWLGDWVGTFIGHKGAVWSSKLSHDATKAVTGSADFTAKVWDTSSGDALLTLPHPHIVRSVAISPSANAVATGCQDKRVRIFDLSSSSTEGQMLGSDAETHTSTVRSVVWDEPRRQVISAGEDGAVKWWDLRSNVLAHSVSYPEQITSLEKPFDSSLLSLVTGKDVSFIDLDTQQTFLSHKLNYKPTTASIHPTSRSTFVTGSSEDGWVRVHDAETGVEREVYKGHHGPVWAISYSPDGEMYASGSEDGTIRLWQTSPKSYGLWRLPEDS